MKIVDANIILRYLLNDTEELAMKATDIIENNKVLAPNEVIAEIVYVLEKVYKVKNDELSETLTELFQKLPFWYQIFVYLICLLKGRISLSFEGFYC